MNLFDWFYEKIGGKPRTEEWYRQELRRILTEHKRIKEELGQIDIKLTVSQVADPIKEKISQVGKLASKRTRLMGDENITALRIHKLLRDMRRHSYQIPKNYFDEYPDLVHFRDEL